MKNTTNKELVRLYCIAFGPLLLAAFIGTVLGGITGACIGAGLVIAVSVLKPYKRGQEY